MTRITQPSRFTPLSPTWICSPLALRQLDVNAVEARIVNERYAPNSGAHFPPHHRLRRYWNDRTKTAMKFNRPFEYRRRFYDDCFVHDLRIPEVRSTSYRLAGRRVASSRELFVPQLLTRWERKIIRGANCGIAVSFLYTVSRVISSAKEVVDLELVEREPELVMLYANAVESERQEFRRLRILTRECRENEELRRNRRRK